MKTKLTLRLDEELIKKAKIVASQKEKSLSKMVSDYFEFITSTELGERVDLPPHVKNLYGALANEQVDESDYIKYLENKYL
jgi:hypothetical protein